MISFPRAVVMGVSGCGKSTVGTRLAERLGVSYLDADDLHPAANVAKMKAGTALTDADREPWLEAVARAIADRPGGVVVSCSALRRAYRDTLRTGDPDLAFLHLDGPQEVALERVSDRPEHFMPPSLVASQYAALEPLEPDERGTVVPFTLPVDEIVDTCVRFLAGRS